jgi:sulfide:quinone oxidoreductase
VTATRVLIVGGGVAALEAMLALRRLAEERVEIALISPEKSFAYRPLSVAEPFGLGAERRFDLAEIVADAGAELLEGRISSVDAATKTVWTTSDASLGYDALVIACGARRRAPFPEALTFWGPGRDQMTELLEDLEGGWVKSVAFALPGGCGWPLPLYELALLTSSHLAAEGEHGVELMIVTPEAAPLEMFGADGSERIRRLLKQRGIGLFTDSHPSAFRAGELSLSPAGQLRVERMVTLPRVEGPGIDGLPSGLHGFIPVDLYGRVPGLEGVYAAGDATTVPIKQGGLAAQLADVVAAEIAFSAGATVEPEPFRPVLRGMLLTGETPRYLRTELVEGAGEGSTVAEHALWWPPSKIAGHHLAPYLATLATAELDPPVPTAREPVPVQIEIDAARLADGR